MLALALSLPSAALMVARTIVSNLWNDAAAWDDAEAWSD